MWVAVVLVVPGTSNCFVLVGVGEAAYIPGEIFRAQTRKRPGKPRRNVIDAD